MRRVPTTECERATIVWYWLRLQGGTGVSELIGLHCSRRIMHRSSRSSDSRSNHDYQSHRADNLPYRFHSTAHPGPFFPVALSQLCSRFSQAYRLRVARSRVKLVFGFIESGGSLGGACKMASFSSWRQCNRIGDKLQLNCISSSTSREVIKTCYVSTSIGLQCLTDGNIYGTTYFAIPPPPKRGPRNGRLSAQ